MAEFSESFEELVPKPEEKKLAEELTPQPVDESLVKLSQPSKELAIRLLNRVNAKNAIMGLLKNIEGNDYKCPIFSLE